MSRFDPASYPGPRPDGPVVVVDAEVVPLHLDPAATVPLRPAGPLPGRGTPPVLAPGAARFSVAYGANASPPRLIDKELTVDGAILLPARLRGFVPAFEMRRTVYGSVPLTLVPVSGVVSEVWVLGVTPRLTDLLDRTEGRVRDHTPSERGAADPTGRFAPPGTYQLGRVGDVEVADRLRLRDALAYLPGPGTRVQVVDGGWRTWPEYGQAAAAAHLETGGPSRPAPPLGAPVLGAWPPTPLEPLG